MPDSPANLLQQIDYAVVQQCMHCGMCLPTCPTYDETGRERHSPRGRIALMRAVADGRLDAGSEFADEMAYCVGCLACQTACPADVDYAHLIETARAEAERSGMQRGWRRRLLRWVTLRQLFTRPWLLRLVGRFVAFYQRPAVRGAVRRLGLLRLAPKRLRELEPKAPVVDPPFSFARIAETESPRGKTRYRVGLLVGCVQDIAYARINRATVDVLVRNGCEVVSPRRQFCCGSLHAHNGDPETARALARRNLDAFDLDRLDAIISNAGGCGSHMKRYAELLAGDAEYRAKAESWDRKVRDVQEWLVEIGFDRPRADAGQGGAGRGRAGQGGAGRSMRTAYDASCHLLHGQRVRDQPLKVLRAIPGVELTPLAESDWCCGSAGVYSLTQPETSGRLLERKLNHIAASGAEVVASANAGCLLQIATGCQSRPNLDGIRVAHPIELLAEGYAAEPEPPERET